ncbi:Gfo/Idh/MocA family oxidoreductase [Patescibacteria group bacterium]|nr:Gfo/Idh/MocA family oxidoreductase [Patescibacteria group bacterium]
MAKLKIRTAIIGLGKIAHGYEDDKLVLKRMDFPTHFSALREHSNFELVATQDISAKVRTLFKRKIKKNKLSVTIYSDWQKMVEAEKLELVVVATNTDSHAKICDKLIDLGVKNILCEKPISYSLEESKKLIKKAEKAGCVLFVNYFRAFNDSYARLIKKIKSRFLGRIQSFDVKYSRGIFNNGTHMIDLLIRMFGEVKTARGVKNLTCNFFEKDPTINASLQFKNGISGYIHGLNNDFYNIFELDILGEKGRIKIINDKAELFLRGKSKLVKGCSVLKIQSSKNLISIKDGLYPVYENIYLNLKNKEKNKCSGKDALKSLEVADKSIRIARYECAHTNKK